MSNPRTPSQTPSTSPPPLVPRKRGRPPRQISTSEATLIRKQQLRTAAAAFRKRKSNGVTSETQLLRLQVQVLQAENARLLGSQGGREGSLGGGRLGGSLGSLVDHDETRGTESVAHRQLAPLESLVGGIAFAGCIATLATAWTQFANECASRISTSANTCSPPALTEMRKASQCIIDSCASKADKMLAERIISTVKHDHLLFLANWAKSVCDVMGEADGASAVELFNLFPNAFQFHRKTRKNRDEMQVQLLTLLSLAASILAHLSIIEPTGNHEYKVGDTMTITWTNEGYDPTTPLSFELADASQGANRITPIGVTLVTNTTVGALQVTATIPAGVANGAAYCVRADIKNPTAFDYYFSPVFPIGVPVGSVVVVTSSAAGAAGTSAGAGSGSAAAGSAAATTASVGKVGTATTTSGAQKIGALLSFAAGMILFAF
ncbi:hypothetical protein HDU98_007797 [Podochytrium sp. JEL0797]|nr:hypothetical protein HDU98_007797 [Podochytrium sp. JEL0797]